MRCAAVTPHPPGRVRAVIFDLFETLVSQHAEAPAMDMAGALDAEPRSFGLAWARMRKRRNAGELPDFAQAMRILCDELDVNCEPSVVERLAAERRARRARTLLNVEPMIEQTLLDLREHGIRLGLLSNAAPEELEAWPDSPLRGLLNETAFSCFSGQLKPAAASYLQLCSALDCPPGQTLFVGNGGSCELMGAHQAGLAVGWARWFIERWPVSRRGQQYKACAEQFPALSEPAELLPLLGVAPRGQRFLQPAAL